jgi:hypothetical protein
MHWRREQTADRIRVALPDAADLPEGALGGDAPRLRAALLATLASLDANWREYPCAGYAAEAEQACIPDVERACDRRQQPDCPRRRASGAAQAAAPLLPLPAAVLRVLLARPEQTPALAAATAWFGGQSPVLLLHGPPRAGKSVAAGWCARQGDALWVASYELPEPRAVVRARLLILDAVDRACCDVKGRRRVEAILDARRDARARGRVLLTADTPADAATGEPLRSRIGERCWAWLADAGAHIVGVSAWSAA